MALQHEELIAQLQTLLIMVSDADGHENATYAGAVVMVMRQLSDHFIEKHQMAGPLFLLTNKPKQGTEEV